MKIVRVVLLLTLSLCAGCGGGTAGTGSGSGSDAGFERVLRGQVTDAQGVGVPGASVVVLETGDSTISGINGDFSLVAALPSSSASVEVTKDDFKAEQRLESLSPTTSVIRLDVELVAGVAASTISDFEFSVLGISGSDCMDAFAPPKVFSFVGNADPLVVVDQIRPVVSGSLCTVEVRTAAFGALQSGVPFQIVRVRPQDLFSDETKPEQIVGTGITGADGVGAAEFPFVSADGNQGYYLVEAPSTAPSNARLGVVINPGLMF